MEHPTRTAVITGASWNIGRAIALQLARRSGIPGSTFKAPQPG